MANRRDADGAWDVSAMIPGAFTVRPRGTVEEPKIPVGPAGPHTRPADADDLERRGREREAGGAPPHREYSGVTDFVMRALLGLTEGFIRLMRTAPSVR
jgi:hypothetical protein